MVVDYEWFSPTRMAGLAAYTLSGLVCVARWIKGRQKDEPVRSFAIVSCMELALLLDMAFDWRWKIHNFWMHKALDEGIYGDRRPFQLVALGILGLLGALGMALILHRLRYRLGGAIAGVGALVSLELWCCECLSYHFIEAVLYRLVGKLMVIGLVWLAVAGFTCLGVWMDARSALQNRGNN